MKEILNHKIKFREGFRPFCPSVLHTDFHALFESKADHLPFMTINAKVKSDQIPSVTHVDQTARVQTVSDYDHPLFVNVLEAIKTHSGRGIVVNTSFNRNQEPIVHSPLDAVSTFFGSGLDELFIGPYKITKA